jgi:hypothetical protein
MSCRVITVIEAGRVRTSSGARDALTTTVSVAEREQGKIERAQRHPRDVQDMMETLSVRKVFEFRLWAAGLEPIESGEFHK